MKVMALRNMTTEKAYAYGEGEYLGDKEPEVDWFPAGIKNPCIQLTNGNYIWGFECWWGPYDKVIAEIGSREIVTVAQTEVIQPRKEKAS